MGGKLLSRRRAAARESATATSLAAGDGDAGATVPPAAIARARGESVAALAAQEQQPEQELIMNLEPDQLVFETFRPVPRAELGAPAIAGLWVLRVFSVSVSLMVIYAFIERL